MKYRYELTEENVADQIAEIRSRVERLMTPLTAGQVNWQPDGGRRWSIGQCLDHLTKSTHVYSAPISEAVASAPPGGGKLARPNLLGRAFIWFLEPPARFKTPAPAAARPATSFDPSTVRREFESSLTTLQSLTARAVKVDSGRARFANPFASGNRVFNVATGILVMLAHARRHLAQAEQVKAHAGFPSA